MKDEFSRKRIIQLIALLIAAVVATYFVTRFFLDKKNEFAPEKTTPMGECIKVKPTSGNYVHVKMKIKGKEIKVRKFIWNGIDYSRRCFTGDGSGYTYDAYVPDIKDSPIPFELLIRSATHENEIEYAIQVYDLNDHLIQKFPPDAETTKVTIDNLKDPLIVSKVVNPHP